MAQETAESVRAGRIVAGSHAKMQLILEQIAETLCLIHTRVPVANSIATLSTKFVNCSVCTRARFRQTNSEFFARE